MTPPSGPSSSSSIFIPIVPPFPSPLISSLRPQLQHNILIPPIILPNQTNLCQSSNMDRSDDHTLDLGLSLTKATTQHHLKKQPPNATSSSAVLVSTKGNNYEPSLTLCLSGDQPSTTLTTPKNINHAPSSSSYGFNNSNNRLVCRTTVPSTVAVAEEAANSTGSQIAASPQYCNSASGVSSVSYNMNNNNNNCHVKREREMTEEVEVEKVMSTRGGGGGNSDGDEEEEEGNTRKKLRLNKDQSALLEESFKLHSTLNPKQKQALANQLNLRPRQVEVWFQNRRARTKLKQTEVDCEFLKKCCESLTEENRRLQKELQELKTLKLASSQPPFYIPAPTLTMCPSCERIGTGGKGSHVGAAGSNSKLPFTNNTSTATKSHLHHHRQFYNSYTNPSAAC